MFIGTQHVNSPRKQATKIVMRTRHSFIPNIKFSNVNLSITKLLRYCYAVQKKIIPLHWFLLFQVRMLLTMVVLVEIGWTSVPLQAIISVWLISQLKKWHHISQFNITNFATALLMIIFLRPFPYHNIHNVHSYSQLLPSARDTYRYVCYVNRGIHGLKDLLGTWQLKTRKKCCNNNVKFILLSYIINVGTF
jgi:hypothetical protein